MEFKFRCPKCNRKLEVDVSACGTSLPCPNCRAVITVPPYAIGPGLTIGGFRIERPIGKGAMGEVFLATQLTMARKVALKILPSQVTSNREFVERFLHEVRMAAKLEHANIVSAFDAGEDHGVYYFAMAYVNGLGLDLRLKQQGALPEKEALSITIKIAQALSYAWDHFHLLHRDIKPANIIMDADGEPMLTDLGIAKTIGEDGGGNLTATGVAVGTPHYMSPEQARGKSNLDFRADMYSLGGTLYHLVVGKVPFPGKSSMEVVAKHLHDPLPSARKQNPAVSQACADLIATMMAKDRTQRYSSWQACIHDLQAVAHGRASAAAMVKAARQASEQLARQHRGAPAAAKRRRLPAPLLAILLLLLVTVAVLGVLLLKTRKRGRPDNVSLPPAKQTAARPAAVPQTATHRQPAAPPTKVVGQQKPRPAKPKSDLIPAAVKSKGESAPAPKPEAPNEKSATAASPQLGSAPSPQDSKHGNQPPATATQRTGKPAETEKKHSAPPAHDTNSSPAAALDPVADDLLHGRCAKALNVWRNAAARNAIPAAENRKLDGLVQEVCKLPTHIFDSFRQDVGRTVTVQMKDGEQRCLIKAVNGTTVRAMLVLEHGAIGKTFTLDDLHLREKIHRLGGSETPAKAIMLGVLAYESGRSDVAVKLFRKYDNPLSQALLRRLEQAAAQNRELAAKREFDAMLRVIAKTTSQQDDKLIRAIRAKSCSSAKRATKARKLVAHFRDRFADTGTGKRWLPVIEKALLFPVPGLDWTIPDEHLEFAWIPALNFWVGRYEITNAQYREFDPEHRSGNWRLQEYTLDRDDQPVVNVSFTDAKRYAEWLTTREQQADRLPEHERYRLPVDTEWEVFASCGDQRRFPWGPAWPPPAEWNYNGTETPLPDPARIADRRDPYPVTCPVTQSGKNDWGLYGVGGNAAEWTIGRAGPPIQVRGGCWAGAGSRVVTPERFAIQRFTVVNSPDTGNPFSGFRLVLAPAQNETGGKKHAAP